MTSDLWSSVPWTAFSAGSGGSKVSAWHKHRVPYIAAANDLQNVDVWIPVLSSDQTSAPAARDILRKDGIWIIYIHGGAWRDPKVDSSSFNATVTSLLSREDHVLSRIAGLASINYTLSPHPSHPTDPTPPPGSDHPPIPSRNAHHPQHILDVLTAINYMQSLHGFGSNYILAGHSCGATLSFQVAMDHIRWAHDSLDQTLAPSVTRPATILGLSGLYDLPGLIHNPGEGHAKVIPIYKAFTQGAFGTDEAVWEKVSPTCVRDWSKEWFKGKRVTLVQSKEDSLVPYSQTELMKSCLKKYDGSDDKHRLKVVEMHASGDHNDLWQKGDRLAEILIDLL